MGRKGLGSRINPRSLPATSQPRSLALDSQNPWPGPDAYDEASSRFFHGRQREAIELLRIIRLAPLTVLYGKSGLGKTSLLKAGLFPLLRQQHYLPVYLRIDFSDEAACPPLEQIAKRMREEFSIMEAEYPHQSDDEGLWEYLHRESIEFWSKANFLLSPVFVFDQFEELISNATHDSERAQRLRESLADLIENRIPAKIADNQARRKEHDLDLFSQKYRVVLSFREDYLPDLKSWEVSVPSLLRNCYRLEPMTRQCATEAVVQAGAGVLDDGVAPLIVDLVGRAEASASEGSRAFIEPVLLCLCCYQLNLRRKRGEKITKAMVDSSGQDILNDFYRVALDDGEVKGAPNVALFIENYLVQGDQFRGTYPKAEAINGGLLRQTQLDVLTNRHRLLRVVQYSDTARIELIHDRLIEVVRKVRDDRRIKEHQTRMKLRLQGALAAIGLILLVLGGLVYRNYTVWVEARPWATLDSLITGQRYPLSQDVANIGRPAPDVSHLVRQVELLSPSVSRIHMMIFRNYYAIDVRSLKGTIVNGEFLSSSDPKLIGDGDTIVLAGAAAFRFRPLKYMPWQFFWNPPLPHQASPAGWGLLIDGRRRLVFPLTRDDEFIIPTDDGGVEPSDRPEGATAIVRRRRLGEGEDSSDVVPVQLYEHRRDHFEPGERELLAFGTSHTPEGSADPRKVLTVESVGGGWSLEADIKLDDDTHGRIAFPKGKPYRYINSARGTEITGVVFHQGERRFQVIWRDPDVENSARSTVR